jgi:glycosyltransferase involved in cell wall biosynthesis
MTLRFTVIIPTLNRRDMMLSALQSIRAQDWGEVEIIVVDGGSTDGTIEELIERHDVQLITGRDRGLYDALNIGISRASGDVIGLLNSDDAYEPNVFPRVAATFEAFPKIHAVCGSAAVVAADHTVQLIGNDSEKALTSPRTALIGSCMLNARFFRRSAATRIGLFSLDYCYVSDRDWLVRWYEAGLKIATIPDLVYRYRQHPGSLTFDAERRHEVAIRLELLALARRWCADSRASRETRRIAALLEGRCVGTLAIKALRKGDFGRVGQLLFRDASTSVSPFASVLRGGADWLVQKLRSSTRHGGS